MINEHCFANQFTRSRIENDIVRDSFNFICLELVSIAILFINFMISESDSESITKGKIYNKRNRINANCVWRTLFKRSLFRSPQRLYESIFIQINKLQYLIATNFSAVALGELQIEKVR